MTYEVQRVHVADIQRFVSDGWRVMVPRTFGSTVEWVWMRRDAQCSWSPTTIRITKHCTQPPAEDRGY